MIKPKQVFSKENRALFLELVRTDFKLRYQGSVLGYLWSLLKPLMLFGILYTVFTQFLSLGKGVPNYAVSLLLGIVLWTFFVEATNSSLKSIVGRGSLIRKIKIPIYMIPLSTTASAFINLFFNLIVVFIFTSFAQTNAFSWATVIVLPLLILELAILSSAVGLFLSAAYVKFRDIDHIWDVVRQALFYTVPIIYPLSRIPDLRIQKLISLNPLSQIIQEARRVTTYSGSVSLTELFNNPLVVFIPVVAVILALVFCVYYFKKQSERFGEIV